MEQLLNNFKKMEHYYRRLMAGEHLGNDHKQPDPVRKQKYRQLCSDYDSISSTVKFIYLFHFIIEIIIEPLLIYRSKM